MSDWIKQLGYLTNIAKGSESVSNQMSHLIVGVLYPLSPTAAALRISISFYTGALLEIPTGIIGDRMGHTRALGWGYAILSLASCFLLWSCLSAPTMSLLLLILSSLMSATGGSMVSGCFQAFTQDYIESHSGSGTKQGSVALDEKNARQMLLSQRYGNIYSALMPALVLIVVFLSHWLWKNAFWALIIPGLVYARMSLFFFTYTPSKQNYETVHHIELPRFVSNLRAVANAGDLTETLLLFAMLILSILTVIHVHTYLMISQLNGLDLRNGGMIQIAKGIAIMVSYDLAHYIKAGVADFIARFFLGSRATVLLSVGMQMAIAVLAIFGLSLGMGIVAEVVFVLCFRAAFTPGSSVLQYWLMARFPESARATVFSCVQVAVLSIYASYSAWIVRSGDFNLDPEQVFVHLIFINAVFLLFYFAYIMRAAWARKGVVG